ncbi:unnamed protein product, partial [Didymodactylos carnosus]
SVSYLPYIKPEKSGSEFPFSNPFGRTETRPEPEPEEKLLESGSG